MSQEGSDGRAAAAGIQDKLDGLMHAWDARDAMGPLSLALDGQAAISGVKEGWIPLRDALMAIQSEHHSVLLETELAAVSELIQTLDGLLQG